MIRGETAGILLATTLLPAVLLIAASASLFGAEEPPVLTEKENKVEASPPPRRPFVPADVGRRLKVNEIVAARRLSRGVVRVSRSRHLRIGPESQIRILKSYEDEAKMGLEITKGNIYMHSREDWLGAYIRTRTVTAYPDGTQFVVSVEDDGTTTVSVLEGSVALTNQFGNLNIKTNEQALVEPGKAPRRTAVIDVRKTVQWCLYYPAVLNLAELEFTVAEKQALANSIAAYRAGDLLGGLRAWPEDYQAASSSARALRAMLVLSVGEVEMAQQLVSQIAEGTGGRAALEALISAVTERGPEAPAKAVNLRASGNTVSADGTQSADRSCLASESLARSYLEQSRTTPDSLGRALEAATRAWVLDPEFGFAAVRVAELQFSFGRIRESLQALESGLRHTPRNAQAWALRGFLLSGQNRIEEATRAFDTAIDIDSALGNAWLGRGLCKIRMARREEGRRDLQIATVLEPNRALLHSYLGKSSSDLGLGDAASNDLTFAKRLDPNDPTPWLYSAIEQQRLNRPNLAINDLQESIILNDNRRLYRSRFLLDQDQAVRSANLASIYLNAGMVDVAVREATRAVESDYTNPSAHLFLANSFDALRDPTRVSLRYETPWFNELLLSNLLSPVGGGPLSQFVSQQEYSKLFAADGLGGSFLGEWRSDSQTRSTASVFGTHGNASFGIDVNYLEGDSQRPNSDYSLWEVYAQLKFQVSPDDIVYFLGKWQDQESQDNFQTFDNQPLSPELEFDERQEPGLLLAGWNHQWAPGTNTLFLGGRLSARQRLRDPKSRQLLVWRDSGGLIPGFLDFDTNGDLQFADPTLRNADPRPGGLAENGDGESLFYPPELLDAISPFLGTGEILEGGVDTTLFSFDTLRDFEIYSIELQHLVQSMKNTLLLGGRVQDGEFRTKATLLVKRPDAPGGFSTPASEQNVTSDFSRTSLYAYDYWSVRPDLTLIGGVSWDRVEHPENFRNPPISEGKRVDERVSGKAGFTYAPAPSFVLRGAFAEGLGGVTFDESVRLEPVQLAGFNQAYRTVISESIAGSVEAPEFTTWGLSMEGALPSRTWWGLSLNAIEQDVDRTIGSFTGYDDMFGIFDLAPAFFPHGTTERLKYEELSLVATINQLIGSDCAVGARYRVTHSELRRTLPELLGSIPQADLNDEATLHEFSIFGDWNSPTGFFAHLEANWYSQDLDDDPAGGVPRKGDAFTHLNALVGYRFNQNQAEISAGLLNILDENYRLSPLNPYLELPRERTFVLRCRWNF